MINIDMWYGDKPDEFRLFLMSGKEPVQARYRRGLLSLAVIWWTCSSSRPKRKNRSDKKRIDFISIL